MSLSVHVARLVRCAIVYGLTSSNINDILSHMCMNYVSLANHLEEMCEWNVSILFYLTPTHSSYFCCLNMLVYFIYVNIEHLNQFSCQAFTGKNRRIIIIISTTIHFKFNVYQRAISQHSKTLKNTPITQLFVPSWNIQTIYDFCFYFACALLLSWGNFNENETRKPHTN